jgi:hypothetical protein
MNSTMIALCEQQFAVLPIAIDIICILDTICLDLGRDR